MDGFGLELSCGSGNFNGRSPGAVGVVLDTFPYRLSESASSPYPAAGGQIRRPMR